MQTAAEHEIGKAVVEAIRFITNILPYVISALLLVEKRFKIFSKLARKMVSMEADKRAGPFLEAIPAGAGSVTPANGTYTNGAALSLAALAMKGQDARLDMTASQITDFRQEMEAYKQQTNKRLENIESQFNGFGLDLKFIRAHIEGTNNTPRGEGE